MEDEDGILSVDPQTGGDRVSIAYEPDKISEQKLRALVLEHIEPHFESREGGGLRRMVLRLDGRACEAAAQRLESRVQSVHGVRRAIATYVGKVLCLTFDPAMAAEPAVLAGVRLTGAAVEPLKPKAATRTDLWHRLRSGELNEVISCAIALLCLLTAAVLEHGSARSEFTWAFYAAAYVFGGQYGVRSAIASLRERTLDVDLLMVLAALGAALVGAPFEGALLLFLFSLSNVLQGLALDRTQRAIESLLTLRPDRALRRTKNGSGYEEVSIDTLAIGDEVMVRPGDLMPVDGEVVEGTGTVDESSLTGESMPVTKSAGCSVYAGTLNQSGGLHVRVTRASEDSTLARMVRLVAEAQAEKSATQRFLERAEQRYAAGVIGFTVLVWLIPWWWGGEEFATAFYRAMTVMVVASPCALIISTPATVLSAIGGAARRGLLIKGGAHLETSARVNVVCLDKTGTITVGKPAVTDILTREHTLTFGQQPLTTSVAEVLSACAALEKRSEHPLAAAIVTAAETVELPIPKAEGFTSVAGKGAQAEVAGIRRIVGSARFLQESGASGMEEFQARADELQARGRTCIWMAQSTASADDAQIRPHWQVQAVFALSDTLRPGAAEMIKKLRHLGVERIIMLTGDHGSVAKAIADGAGVDEYYAELLPADKVSVIKRLKESGTVMMVGDGVNDAPALATADLGVAMGAAGTDIAMETADVVLMGDQLSTIPGLLGLARHARRVLRQNLVFASGVVVVLVVAALGFALPLPLGVIGHEGSTVLVCLNGLRLLAYRPR